MNVRELLIKLGVKSDLSGLTRADRQIEKTKGLGRELGDVLKMSLGHLGAQAVTALVGELRNATEEAISFQRTLGQIQSLIPGNVVRAKEYREEIGRLAVQYGRSAKDLGDGAYEILSTFGDTKDSIKLLEIATKAGAAGNATTSDGIAALTAMTKSFGDTSVEAAQKVSDLAFQTVNLGVVKLPELGSDFGKAAPLAAALGVQVEELFATMATASGVTGTGSEVSTQISSLMRGLTDRSKEAKIAFKEAFGGEGIETMAQAIGKYGMVGAVDKLIKTTDGSAEALVTLFGRAEATTLALHLTGKGAGDFRQKLEAMRKSAGATDTAYRAMTSGLAQGAQDIAVARAKTEQLRLELGDNLLPVLFSWEMVQGRIYKAMNDNLVPMLQDPSFFEFGVTVDGIESSFSALGVTVAIVANAVDTLLGALYTANAFTGAFLAAVDPTEMFSDNGWNNAKAILAQNDKELVQRGSRMSDRIKLASGETTASQWKKIRDAAKLEADADRAKRSAMIGRAVEAGGGLFKGQAGGAGGVFNAMMGGVTVNVSVPDGTTASAAARIGDMVPRVVLQQFMEGAARAFPQGTPEAAANSESDW